MRESSNSKKTKLRFKFQLNFDKAFPYFMVAPTIAIIGILTIYPIIIGIMLSFYNYTLVMPVKPFIGFRNYLNLLSDLRFLFILGNTVLFAVGSPFSKSIIKTKRHISLNWFLTLDYSISSVCLCMGLDAQ